MAALPWKPLYWERFGDSFSYAGVARGHLAAVARVLASPLRGGDERPALVRFEECEKILAEASKLLAFAVSALGTTELLALRCMRAEDTTENSARAKARAAREMVGGAYDSLASSRGHLGAAERLFAATGISDHAVEEEREAVLAAIQAGLDLLDGVQALRSSDAGLADEALPRAVSLTRSASATPTVVGGSSHAAWSSLGGTTPGQLLRVALSGAVPEIEGAQAALQVGAEAVDKASKGAAADLFSAAADWSARYDAVFHALDAAHSALSGVLALNNEASILLLRCAPHLYLDRAGKEWRSWEASRADADRHGRAALDHLWSASAYVDLCLAGVLAWSSTTSAGQEAQDLMRRALADAGEARDAGDQLRHAAAREFFHVWMLVQCAPSVLMVT